MRVLITGITGFAGSHMAEMLFPQKDIELFGTYRRRSRLENLENLLPHLNLIEVRRLQREHDPRRVRARQDQHGQHRSGGCVQRA